MAHYEIINTTSGASLGIYQGASEEEAIFAMHLDAGAPCAETDPDIEAREFVYSDLVNLIKEWANCIEADIDPEGDIWIAEPQRGHWLDAEEKATFQEWITARAS